MLVRVSPLALVDYCVSSQTLCNAFFSVEAVPDYSKLTLTQAKRLEMESQVRKSHFNLVTFNSGQLENLLNILLNFFL